MELTQCTIGKGRIFFSSSKGNMVIAPFTIFEKKRLRFRIYIARNKKRIFAVDAKFKPVAPKYMRYIGFRIFNCVFILEEQWTKEMKRLYLEAAQKAYSSIAGDSQ